MTVSLKTLYLHCSVSWIFSAFLLFQIPWSTACWAARCPPIVAVAATPVAAADTCSPLTATITTSTTKPQLQTTLTACSRLQVLFAVAADKYSSRRLVRHLFLCPFFNDCGEQTRSYAPCAMRRHSPKFEYLFDVVNRTIIRYH